MFTSLSPELKTALLELPEKEKDRLLLRLVKKDKILIEQLHFQLLEDESDLEDRRIRTFNRINKELYQVQVQLSSGKYYYPKNLLVDLRLISGLVNQHALITKDKLGELDMRIHILAQVFQCASSFFQYDNYANDRLLVYTVGRLKNIFTAYDKLHEDLQYDYEPRLKELVTFANSSAIKNYSRELSVPKLV